MIIIIDVNVFLSALIKDSTTREILLRFIRIIPDEELLDNWVEAKQIMEHIDPEDVTFIAAALSQDDAIIWSDDRHFEKQDKVITLKTKEVVNLFESN